MDMPELTCSPIINAARTWQGPLLAQSGHRNNYNSQSQAGSEQPLSRTRSEPAFHNKQIQTTCNLCWISLAAEAFRAKKCPKCLMRYASTPCASSRWRTITSDSPDTSKKAVTITTFFQWCRRSARTFSLHDEKL